jgi:hypothetical protein
MFLAIEKFTQSNDCQSSTQRFHLGNLYTYSNESAFEQILFGTILLIRPSLNGMHPLQHPITKDNHHLLKASVTFRNSQVIQSQYRVVTTQ